MVGNLSFTNYEIKPHVTNVTFDGSNAVIIEFSRDISNVSTYSPNDFSVVHDGSSISVLSVYESSNNLVLNFEALLLVAVLQVLQVLQVYYIIIMFQSKIHPIILEQ